MSKIYTIQAPDGKVLTLEGPDGASEDEVIGMAQRLYQPRPPAPQTPAQRALRESALTDTDVSRMTAPGKASGVQPIENTQDAQGRNVALGLAGAGAALGFGGPILGGGLLGAASNPMVQRIAKEGAKRVAEGAGVGGAFKLVDWLMKGD